MSSKFLFIESMEILSTIPQYYTLLKIFTVLLFLWFIIKKLYPRENITEDVLNKKLAEWRPEPLVPEVDPNHPSLHPLIVTSRVGKNVVINGKKCLNVGSQNYLGLTESRELDLTAMWAVKKYGVGSCGPRGFYGTIDTHLDLEERLAKFTGTEEAIVFSYAFSTVSTAIPAYCKKNDLVYVDSKINYAIQKGLDASRSTIIYFNHNDVQHLEELLLEQDKKDKQNPKKAAKIKRFLIIEGIYAYTGQICPLPELVALRKKYKLRLFIDESISIGTLGANGKGVTEHFDVPKDEIDMIMGSFETAMGSVGGFCAGTSFIIEHQRLGALGYCFSASLAPLLTKATITAITIMEKSPRNFERLKENCIVVDNALKEVPYIKTTSSVESPLKHLYLKEEKSYLEEVKILNSISKKCIENKLAIVRPIYLENEYKQPRPSLRLCVSVLLDDSDIDFAISTLKKCVNEVFK
ncbi:PREDICTED: serine palmitoyltransferase 1 [Polistes dominula]|uniref:Serine palmitoyltransferase 1 n=1 Tax=Polistes dominula TaxID=743375 RepID=A0ABM1IT83_POLDO|nr:PREDICTED: serine palmitoyltransferase 1 [Polistes dominula]